VTQSRRQLMAGSTQWGTLDIAAIEKFVVSANVGFLAQGPTHPIGQKRSSGLMSRSRQSGLVVLRFAALRLQTQCHVAKFEPVRFWQRPKRVNNSATLAIPCCESISVCPAHHLIDPFGSQLRFDHYARRSLCRGLFQTLIAA
jgi:hypothetical protein